MILENNEEKRSTLWRVVLTISSIVILIVVVFFVVRMFTGNPLVGTWVNEDSGETMTIETDGKVTVTGEGNQEKPVVIQSEVDTATKIFSIQPTAGKTEGSLSGTYDYNIEQDTLTLTEREYGDQLVFVRKDK